MASTSAFVRLTAAFGTIAFVHALLTWPLDAALALFGGGAALAFVGEAVAVNLDLLEHHVGPTVLGVPLYVLPGWVGAVYVWFRVALLAVDGGAAVLLGAALATGLNVLTDHHGFEQGRWTYTDDIPGPRHRGVPWWNYLGWFVVSAATAALALPSL